MPKISIVLPTYNGEKYIRESIESVCNQTFLDWELIIVNDCSVDNTLQIINEYAQKDSRIRVISNEVNQKLPQSLNIGFREAKGKYLTWTSDDNIYLPEAIGRMSEYLDREKDCYMVCAAMNWIDSCGQFLHKHVEYKDEDLYFYDCVGACFMYRKEVLDEVGEYDTELFLVEDYDYWLRILLRYGHIGYIKDVLYLYRTHNESLSVRTYEIMKRFMDLRQKYISPIILALMDQKSRLCEIYYTFKEYGVKNDAVNQLLKTYVSELDMDSENDLEKKVIIYGAGAYGNKAYQSFADRVVYYADQNEEKVGTYLNNVEVISLDKMSKIGSDYQIVIAASAEKIYDFFRTLRKYGIEKCHVYVPLETKN